MLVFRIQLLKEPKSETERERERANETYVICPVKHNTNKQTNGHRMYVQVDGISNMNLKKKNKLEMREKK